MTDAPTPRDALAAITDIVAEELYHGVSYDDSGDNTNYHGLAKNVLAALTAAGYVVAPMEPIRAMVDAAIERCDDMDQADGLMFYGAIYRAMIAEWEKK